MPSSTVVNIGSDQDYGELDSFSLLDKDQLRRIVKNRTERGTFGVEKQNSWLKDSFTQNKAPSHFNEVGKLLKVKAKNSEQAYFETKQFWEGVVQSVDIDRSEFTAILSDKNNSNKEKVVIDIDEIIESDLPLLTSGTVFYWSIGNYIATDGQLTKQSRFRIRRLKGVSNEQVALAKIKADSFLAKFREE